MMKQLQWQLDSADALDTKIATWFTLPTLVLSVFTALLIAERDHIVRTTIVFAVLGAITWAALVVTLYLGYSSDDWDVGPKKEEIEQMAITRGYTARDMYFSIAHLLVEQSIDANESLLQKKSRLLSSAVLLFFLEVGLFVISILISLKS